MRQKLAFRETRNGDLNSQAGLASKWLQWCTSRHWRCKKTFAGGSLDAENEVSQLPTRVLKIQADGQTRLVETNGASGRYAALSYCWPKNVPPLVTTREVYKSFQSAVPVEKAPRPIRKAITLTQKLGIEYLWVVSISPVESVKEIDVAELILF